MLKYLLIFITTFIGCEGAELKTDGVTSDSAAINDRSWLTWDECGYDITDNPCNFTLVDQHGDEVELYDYYGKVIVVDFSTMWCGVCINIASEGDLLVDRYGEENVVWLTVLIENEYGGAPTTEDIQRWVDMASIQSPVLAGDRSLVDTSAVSGYPITSWPTLVVIDKEMVLKHGINGWNKNAIDAWVGGLL